MMTPVTGEDDLDADSGSEGDELKGSSLSSSDSLGDQLDELRPSSSPGYKQRLFEAVSLNLFDSELVDRREPERLGRFTLLERLGEGGMGIVRSAYDPQLDRRVAIKLIRAEDDDERARARLLREAQALARLSHPNVVQVHEAGVHEGQVFIAMEYVVGQTLTRWLEDERPQWREIVMSYLQAGRGLAAAHDAELVHRDFKPDNVLIGEDGRVRVVDFGLARGHEALAAELGSGERSDGVLSELAEDSDIDEVIERGSSGGSSPVGRLTRTGARLGTPAYMAPEQILGGTVTPLSDQFSFCLALYESLYGQRAFAGKRLKPWIEALRAGDVREPPRASGVPSWVFELLRRGLETEPRERFASMGELLGALEGRLRRTRNWWLRSAALVVVGVGVGVGASFAMAPSEADEQDPCVDAGAELDEQWSAVRRRAITAALEGVDAPYAGAIASQVATGLARYADDWRAASHKSCEAHARGDESDDTHYQRSTCLKRRLVAFEEATGILERSAEDALDNAVPLVERLPRISSCVVDDPKVLGALFGAPPEVRDRVNTVELELTRVDTLTNAGQVEVARALLKKVLRETGDLKFKVLRAEALLADVRVDMAAIDTEPPPMLAKLDEALGLGLSEGEYAVVVEAYARSVYLRAVSPEGVVTAPTELELEIMESMAARVPEGAALRGLLHNNLGSVYLARNDLATARRHIKRAVEDIRALSDEDSVELTQFRLNLVHVTEDPVERERLFDVGIDAFTERLGATHERTIDARLQHALTVSSPARMRTLLREICSELGTRGHANLRYRCHSQLAYLEYELGDTDAAVDGLKRAREANDAMGASVPAIAAQLGAFLALERGAAKDAVEITSHVLDEQQEPLKKWLEISVGDLYLLRGLARLKLGAREQARADLERATEMLEEAAASKLLTSLDIQLARARLGLADALIAGAPLSQEDVARAARELDQAESFYGSLESPLPRRLAQLSELRAAL